jgi:small redox-active disulfide protein 2
MNVKILGAGCANCTKLEKTVQKVLNELEIRAEIEKVTDYKDIAEYGVMNTPALVVDGQVKFSGRVPKEKEIKKLFS